MDRFQAYNPFSKRESHSSGSITTYKVLTILTWLLSIVISFYYTFNEPHDGHTIRKRIWDQNYLYPTAFTMNSIIASIYWLVVFICQGAYIGHLFSKDTERINAAASVGSHFIMNNLFHFAFVMLFVRSHFIWAEVILIINFFNLSSLYFRHHKNPMTTIHFAAVAAPLAWTFVAIYWNGALMIKHPDHVVARIFGNIFIWAILVYGWFFIAVFKDPTMGFCLSTLAAAIGVAQFFNKVIALQWIFAFVIMGVLFVSTVIVSLPAVRRQPEPTPAVADQERAPLLGES